MDKQVCLCCGKEINDGLWHKSCIRRFFNTSSLPRLSINKEEMEKLAIEQLSNKKSVAGVQEKLSLHLDVSHRNRPRLTIIGFPSGYILKPQTAKYKQLPEFEHTAMLLAEVCGLPVVPHALIPINKDNEIAFITKRIDRNDTGKIHMEDFCQASGNTTFNKYRSSYEECMKLIDQYSDKPLFDKVKLFACLYFCFVIGNSDVHLKNFSFLMNDNGSLSLSPFYDLLPTKVILPSDHEDLGMLFNNRKSNLHKHDFDQFVKNVGISNETKNKIIKSINDKYDDMVSIINSSTLNQNAKSVWKKMIKANIKRAELP